MQNLSKMSVDALLKLREDVRKHLAGKIALLRKDLAKLDAYENGSPQPRKKASPLKRRKLPVKFRSGKNTWAGRGATPIWLKEKIKAGAKKQDFLVAKPVRKHK